MYIFIFKFEISSLILVMHKILFNNKFIIRLYIFRALCAHHQEVKILLYSIWYHHTSRWPSRAQVHGTATYVTGRRGRKRKLSLDISKEKRIL